jgi:hypothetical protein
MKANSGRLSSGQRAKEGKLPTYFASKISIEIRAFCGTAQNWQLFESFLSARYGIWLKGG